MKYLDFLRTLMIFTTCLFFFRSTVFCASKVCFILKGKILLFPYSLLTIHVCRLCVSSYDLLADNFVLTIFNRRFYCNFKYFFILSGGATFVFKSKANIFVSTLTKRFLSMSTSNYSWIFSNNVVRKLKTPSV